MKLDIDNRDARAIFAFTPREYILVYGKDERFGENGGHPITTWTLCAKIDRSYKGKDDDIGMPILYLSDSEAEVLKKSGFSYMEHPLSE